MLIFVAAGALGGTEISLGDAQLPGVLPRLSARSWRRLIKPTIKITGFNQEAQEAR